MTTVTQAPFAPNVFEWPSATPRLLGGRCSECSAVTFPQQSSCARCGSTSVESHPLPRLGTLWTFTTQDFLPKEPYASGETQETFRPYGVGMVQLGDEVKVEARLTENDPAKLRIGMDVELVIVPFRVEPDGTEIMTYAFAPVATEGNN